jgi:hypothetical protein
VRLVDMGFNVNKLLRNRNHLEMRMVSICSIC